MDENKETATTTSAPTMQVAGLPSAVVAKPSETEEPEQVVIENVPSVVNGSAVTVKPGTVCTGGDSRNVIQKCLDFFSDTIQNVEGWLEDSAEEMASYDYDEGIEGFFSEYGKGYAGRGGNFSFGKLFGSVMKGGVNLCGGVISGMVTTISHPIQTIENIPQIYTALKESVKQFQKGNWTQKVEIATEMTGTALMLAEAGVKGYKNYKGKKAAKATMAETEAELVSETESVLGKTTSKTEGMLAKSAKEIGKAETTVAEGICDINDIMEMYNELSFGEKIELFKKAKCFTAHTKVSTPDGMRYIEELQPGDYVYAEDINTNVSEIRKIKAVFRRKKDIFVYLKIGDEEICCTPEHPFWGVEKGWTKAKDLLPGDTLKQRDGQIVKISRIRHEKLSMEENVYNLEIEGVHTYYVSAGEILVHNADGYGKVKIERGTISKLINSADDIIKKAQSGKLKYHKKYHGRLGKNLEQEILSNPDAVYVTTNNKQNFVYRKGNNVVIVESQGSSKGNIITSYGPGGPRGESGAKIFGGSPTDLGMPVTHEDIMNGIKQPSGEKFPPAVQIK